MKRDLYDLSFICNRYWNVLSEISIAVVRNAVGHRGLNNLIMSLSTKMMM